MKESLTARVKRIISGSASALVDAIEDMAPEIVMEEAIREVDGALDDVRAELGKVIAQRHLVSKRLMDQNTRHEALTGHLELAVAEGRDDLAQSAIAQQLDIEAQIPVLEQAIAEATTKQQEFEGYVTALIAKRRQMQQDLRDFRAARAHAEAAAAAGAAPGASKGVDSRVARAESTFDRLMTKHAGLGATATPDAKTSAHLAELEDLSRQHRIQERLAAVKARTSGGS